MTVNFATILLALATGLTAGLAFWGGLYWTLQRLPRCAYPPALFLLLSFVIRMTLTLAMFYWLMGDRWEPLLLALLGFMVVRIGFSIAPERWLWQTQTARAGDGHQS